MQDDSHEGAAKPVFQIGAKVRCSNRTKKWDKLTGIVCSSGATRSKIQLDQKVDGISSKEYANSNIDVGRF